MTSCTCGSSASRRQVVLGLIDLGAHVGERGLGIEAGLELEQHEAAALEGGRAHLLDVADRLELGLDRPQQQPLGILRADAALGELHVDDRDPDVRLGLLRDRHIGDEARAHSRKMQRRDGQPRVADGVVDEPGHRPASALSDRRKHASEASSGRRASQLIASTARQRSASGARHGLDLLAFAHEILALHDHARAVGECRRPT